jgi:hypothetical protein
MEYYQIENFLCLFKDKFKNSLKIKNKILNVIQGATKDFKKYPDKYLTEDDVRCHLFNQLMKIKIFSNTENTYDNSKSISLHSEVRWYQGANFNQEWMNYRTDIAILDVSNLKTSDDIYSKGFNFENYFAIIEIKLRRRINGCADNALIEDIRKDIGRLKEIQGMENKSLFLLILDKKANRNIIGLINTLKDDANNPPNLNIFYESINHGV